MSIDLRLPEKIELINRRFKIPSNVAEEFDLYVQAAQEGLGNDDVDPDVVLEAMLVKTMKKDRKFRAWLKTYRKNGNGNGAGREASRAEGEPGEDPDTVGQ